MSLSAEPDFQDYIVRIVDILKRSALIFPNTVGGDNTATDLVNQIIENQLPIPQLPVDGPGPPHIFVAQSQTPIVKRDKAGRNSLDVEGGGRVVMEYYIVVLVDSVDKKTADSQLFNLISAVTTTLNKNKRLIDSNSLNPLCFDHKYDVVPYIFDITQNTTAAKNIVLRPQVGVNLR